MSTEIVKTENASYLARYQDQQDPYAAFATEGGPGIQGKLLVCPKGDWAVGQDKDPVKAGATALAIVDTMGRGWFRSQNNAVADVKYGLVKDNYLMPHRASLGFDDEAEWEKDPAGNPRDPWSRTYRMLLIEMTAPHGDLTFTSGAWGAQMALQALAGSYSLDKHLYPDAYPIVELTTKSRPHKTYGTIKGPWFLIKSWATIEDVRAGRTSPAKAKKVTAKAVAEELNDELPNWGQSNE